MFNITNVTMKQADEKTDTLKTKDLQTSPRLEFINALNGKSRLNVDRRRVPMKSDCVYIDDMYIETFNIYNENSAFFQTCCTST